MEYMEDLEESLEHAKSICLNHRTGEHVLTPEDYDAHWRLVSYLTSLRQYRITGEFLSTPYPITLDSLNKDIEALEKSLESKELSCEACKNDHRNLLRWMKELKQISTWE